ncbi:MAG: hypothetical protein F4148_02655 [Caldilineaceae bacterium SB0675_bin_29]|uniref:Uncharacterized protein n=1 Tax=Caldilineaceae bacterium SB0675_bin_29 TaxID=2605266 RepID=A0A6B1G3H8_9CHLR|nr:hypothetical protein [Caldilineaceae bacterium SB0675_bin_29]
MKIKNLIGFLLVVILLATGATPVIAHEVSQCGAVEPIRPGDSVADAVSDVPAAHIDITEVETSLSGERLTVVFHLKDLPETLTFNRIEYGKGTKEYEWEVAIDVDNDRSTGPGGFDMLLTAYHIAFLSPEGADAEERTPIADLLDADISAPLEDMLDVSVWEIHPDGTTSAEAYGIEVHSDGSTTTHGAVKPEISTEKDTITFSGVIPGITSESRLAFEAYDVQFAGNADQIACHDAYSKSVRAWGCDSGNALISPGQTATDEIESVVPSYIDVTKVNTSLSGETLTVVFHLREVPETLTFNRTGLSENFSEYAWVVVIDVDDDRETGYGGFEYQLLASHSVPPSEKGSNAKAPIESEVEVSVWSMEPGSSMATADTTLEVSAAANTITLSGYIPGITTESRLAFRTYEYFNNADEVGCYAPQDKNTPSSQCDSDGAVTPGESVSDDVSDALAAHMDVTEISTSLSGETLTVVFHLRDVPETLPFGRTGVPENATEYSWEVSVDVDGDQETGFHGFEYILSASHVVFPGASGRDLSAALSSNVLQTNTWDLNPAGSTNFEISYLEDARIGVSVEEDTITLSGEIPGITAESQLAFGVYDYLGGAEEVGCLTPFGLGRPASFQGSSDGSEVTPGQSVSDDVSHELVGHADIVGITTWVDGETLTVIFHLRDLPETLTFDRTGVPDHVLEYGWAVSIDVDNDRATGLDGFDYRMAANHFVHPGSEDSNTIAAPTQTGFVNAYIWGLDQQGDEVLRILADAAVEFSFQDNTITLSGQIPGITSKSPLAFMTYDYFGGSEEIRTHDPATTNIGSGLCGSDDAAVRPGQRVITAISDTLPAHVDITEVSTTLTGETLAVIFHLRDVPETLEFNRKGVRENMLEYNWSVSVDVDNNRETGGFLGDEYTLSAMRFVPPSSSGETVQLSISQGVQANTWQTNADGASAVLLRDISIEVSSEENTITLIGDIPGITSASRLEFEAYDFLDGSEQVACQVLSIVGGGE